MIRDTLLIYDGSKEAKVTLAQNIGRIHTIVTSAAKPDNPLPDNLYSETLAANPREWLLVENTGDKLPAVAIELAEKRKLKYILTPCKIFSKGWPDGKDDIIPIAPLFNGKPDNIEALAGFYGIE